MPARPLATAFFLLATLLCAPAALAQEEEKSESFSAEELDEIIGPIALYPDDLLALVLPASTYPLQIVQASRFLEKYEKDDSLKPEEEWDESVIGLLNYPDVIDKMNEDLDWTWKLGTAVADQQNDVMNSVQRFRGKADDAGNLESNDKMKVTKEEKEDEKIIVIESTSTEVIYVPTYQPSTVIVYQTAPYPYYYSPPYPYYYRPAARFWTGVFVGAAVGYGMRWGWGGHNDININRNVNIDVDRPDLGGGIGDRDRPGDRDPGDRERGGDRDRGGDRAKTSEWKADKGRGKQSGARPGGESGKRPSTGASTRPGGGAGSKPSARPATSDRKGTADRAGASTRDRSTSSRDYSRPSSTTSRSRDSSFGGYKSGSSARASSSRGHSSRGGAHRSGGGRSRGGGGRRR